MASLVVLVIIVWVAALLLSGLALLLKWKLPFLIGRSGERFVSRELLNLDQQHYKVMNDLLLPSLGNTGTTQIDQVVVSNFGIFCIETKNFEGWIFGSAHQHHWTQVIYRFRKKFYNPLRQNYAHIKAVEEVLKSTFPQVPVRGFVVFPSAEKLQISGTDAVGHARDIIDRIKAFNTTVLSDSDRDTVVHMLLNANINDKNARKLHDRNVHALKLSTGL